MSLGDVLKADDQMRRLLIHVEGQTEETFVNEVLAPHLITLGYANVSARIVGNSRQRSHRGGIKPWSAVRNDIVRHLREDKQCISSTMVDYYALPMSGEKAWPGRALAKDLPFTQKATTIEVALLHDICLAMNTTQDRCRFVPYITMHEFEGLLFSDCKAFSKGIGDPTLEDSFQMIRNAFNTPEEINDSPETAPSKRVEALRPGYEKPFLGTLAALEIGLGAIRSECPCFNNWIERLEDAIG